jgi:hypothetical protein
MPPTVRVTNFDLSNVTEGFVKALEAYAAFVTAGAAPSTQQKTEAAWARQMFTRMGLTTLPKDFVGANEAKGLREIANEVMKARSYLAQKGYLTGLHAALQDPIAKADLEARDKDLRAVVTEASSTVPRIDGPKQAWRFLKKAFGLNDVMPPNVTAISESKFTPSKFAGLPESIATLRDWMAEESKTAVVAGKESIYDKVVIGAAQEAPKDDHVYDSVFSKLEATTLRPGAAGGGAAPPVGGGPIGGQNDPANDDNDGRNDGRNDGV